MRIAGAQLADGPLDYRSRGLEVGITDTEDDDVFAALEGGDRFVMRAPRGGPFAAHPIDQC